MPIPYVLNQVKQLTNTVGLGDIVFTATVVNYGSFAQYLNDQDTVLYYIDDTNGNWESGVGTFNIDPPSLTRTTVISSSNYDMPISFVLGQQIVTSTLDAKIAQLIINQLSSPWW